MKTKIIFSLLIALICAQLNPVSANNEPPFEITEPPIRYPQNEPIMPLPREFFPDPDRESHIFGRRCSRLSEQINLVAISSLKGN